MIHIQWDNLDVGTGWNERAEAARIELENATEVAERRAIVARRAGLWTEIKPQMRAASNGKCWYCESIENRSDNAVDHYRPKGRVHGCDGHEGYWWLAFSKENLRFSCTYCNTYGSAATRGTPGGKSDHFPLWDESKRAWGPGDPLEQEQPLLLDPLAEEDPGLLWLDETGECRAHPSCKGHDYALARASESISRYHLNQPSLIDRRSDVVRSVKDKVSHADSMFRAYVQGNAAAKDAYAQALKDLRAMVGRSSEYSRQALCTLLGMRDGISAVPDAVLSSL